MQYTGESGNEQEGRGEHIWRDDVELEDVLPAWMTEAESSQLKISNKLKKCRCSTFSLLNSVSIISIFSLSTDYKILMVEFF